jgi:oxygen-independent coproporphyrinogen-3 oxidase
MLTSLYIHIPFCDHICTYCDFHKQKATPKTKQQYISALIKELTHYKSTYTSLKTVYIGGGTPLSLEVSELEKLLHAIHQSIDTDSLVEYTIETNPNNITPEKVELLRQYGVNRISIGIQTFNSKHLAFLGRDHTPEDIDNAVSLLKQLHFPNISVDMMFSLIGQTKTELKDDIQHVLSLDVDHISYYSLILEEKTTLHHLVNQNKVSMNSEETEELMYNEVIDSLTNAGYNHYEISNFAKPKYESVHNSTYWLDKEYLGLGSGAHSMVDNKRFYHKRNVTEYIRKIFQHNFDHHEPEDRDSLGEQLMMGMRLIKGIHIPSIETDHNISLFDCYPLLRTYIHRGLLSQENDYLRFTRKGLMVGNMVFRLFLEDPSC